MHTQPKESDWKRFAESWAEWDNLSTLHTLGHLNP